MLQQYASPGTHWAFTRNNTPVATGILLESEWEEQRYGDGLIDLIWHVKFYIDGSIVELSILVPEWHEDGPKYIFLESDGEFNFPPLLDMSYMIPFEHWVGE